MSPTGEWFRPKTVNCNLDEDVETVTKCTYCAEDMGMIYIRCESCDYFGLCLQCFASGAEIGEHKRFHSYRVRSPLPVGPFNTPTPWTLNEENLLLYALDDYGYGNWNDCARLLPGRSPKECRRHFEMFYLGGPVGEACFPGQKPLDSVNLPEIKIDESAKGGQLFQAEASQLLGFNSRRDDFEIEYDSCAEDAITVSVAHLDHETSSHEVEDLDIEFKLARLDHYLRRLKERERRKRLVVDYGLIGWFLRSPNSIDPTANDTLPFALRVGTGTSLIFQKLLTFKEFQEFLANFEEVCLLRSEVERLQEYRSRGFEKNSEIPPFKIEQIRQRVKDR